MKEIYCDVSIIGGGLIGSITAYTLSNLGLTIAIHERNPAFKEKKYLDQRTTAISEGTKNFLDTIDLWKQIRPYCQPIKNIKVIDRNLTNQLNFDNIRRKSNLGYIIKNKDFLKVVYSNLKKNKNIQIFNNVTVDSIENDNSFIMIKSKKTKIISNLNIAADGKNSFVKQFYKTPFYFKNYKKKALVLTFTHSKNHNGTAFEIFYKSGPLAILPMKKNKNNFCSSLVWTNTNEFINSIRNLDTNELVSILKTETQSCIGNIKQIISKQIFPISAHLNSKYFDVRTIYIGDSAHSFHPIAGQGWNQGMKDVESLFKLMKKYTSLGIDVGSSAFCKEYHNDNFYNAYRLYQITDKLDSIFRTQNPIFTFGRFSGINFLNSNKKIKNAIADFAMGIN